jgi:hypothetical protein
MKIQHNSVILVSTSILVGIAIGLAHIGTEYANAKSENAKNTPEDQGITMSGSVAVAYYSMDQMATDADVIVAGTFSDEKILVPMSKFVDFPSRNPKTLEAAPRDSSLINQNELGHLDSGFNISEVIKGNVNSKIYVAQNGVMATTPAASKPVSGDRFFKGGDSYILFLKKALPHSVKNAGGRSFYYVVGAYQGGYRIRNGKVYSRDIEDLDSAKLSKSPTDLGYGHRMNGVDVNSVMQELRNKARN